jgi:hypothetical protein
MGAEKAPEWAISTLLVVGAAAVGAFGLVCFVLKKRSIEHKKRISDAHSGQFIKKEDSVAEGIVLDNMGDSGQIAIEERPTSGPRASVTLHGVKQT